MIYESDNAQPSVNVYPNNNGGNGNGMFGLNDGSIIFVIILFFFAMMMGWGNNGNSAGNNGGTTYVMPMAGGYGYGGPGISYVQQGFDQAAIMGGLNGIQGSLSAGFANAEVSRCNQQANILATMNANQNANTAAMNGLAMSLQNCCCENRAATADLKYTVATEACADRNAVTAALQEVTAQGNANTQRILDKMCQMEMDGIKQNYENRIATLNTQYQAALSENQALRFAASQDNQTATIQTGQRALANEVEQYVNPTARPAYIVQNPNCCANPCGYNQCNRMCG